MQNLSGPWSERLSRRLMLRGVVFVAGAGTLLASTVRADAAQIAKKEVQYQDTPKGADRCDGCSLFIAPASCKTVEGDISPAGWCMLYKAKAA